MIVLCLLLVLVAKAQPSQRRFVSLTLCADRLITEIARPEQVAALSPFSTQPYAMLEINHDKPTVHPELSELIAYADTTILLNRDFYPRLTERLMALGFDVVHIDDNPADVPALFALIRQLGELTGNHQRAEAKIKNLQRRSKVLQQGFSQMAMGSVAVLADAGVIDTAIAQYQTLFSWLHLQPVALSGHFSLEKLLLANPKWVLTLVANADYSEGAKQLQHPVLTTWKNKGVLRAQSKYFLCFDHGIWQGAEQLVEQMLSRD